MQSNPPTGTATPELRAAGGNEVSRRVSFVPGNTVSELLTDKLEKASTLTGSPVKQPGCFTAAAGGGGGGGGVAVVAFVAVVVVVVVVAEKAAGVVIAVVVTE